MVKFSASAKWNGMSARVKWPIVNSPLAGIQLSIVPPFHAWCCVPQLWSVPGVAWALVVRVS
jgi:hypothetical protein